MALSLGEATAIYATTPYGIATSTDEGESWEYHEFPKYNERDPWSYCRGMAMKADDPRVIFVGNGDTMPGMTGDIRVSKDSGKTWTAAELAVEPNSRIYGFATQPAIPEVIVAASIYGYVYSSEDGGDTWQKVRKEFGEIRTLALMPN